MQRMLKMALKLGYEVIVINNDSDEITAKSSKKHTVPVIKAPESCLPTKPEIEEIKKSLGINKKIRVLSRFTANFTNIDQSKRIQNDVVIRSYDIIAVCPATEKLYQVACSSLNVHIICTDLKEKMTFRINRATYGVAVQRGVMFEVSYAPILRDPLFLRNTVANSASLHDALKGKNIVLSSGCDNEMELRSPYDVQNIAALFGLNPEQAKYSITRNCMTCIQQAETNGSDLMKRVVSIERVSDVESQPDSSLQIRINGAQPSEDTAPALTEDTPESDAAVGMSNKRVNEDKNSDTQLKKRKLTT